MTHGEFQPPAMRPGWLPVLSGDGWLLLLACGARLFAYGFLSVVLGLYLEALGLEAAGIGAVFTAALAGGAMMTVLLAGVADRLGRRRVLLLGSALMGLSGAAFALSDQVLLLVAAAMVGTISPSGREVGPFLAVEAAILPQTTTDDRRTSVFVAYNVAGFLAGALGALAAGLPELLGMPLLDGYRALCWGYALVGLLLVGLFARLSPRVEAPRQQPDRPGRSLRPRFGSARSRSIAVKLAALFALDSFAGGFVVQGLVAYWLSLRFGADAATLGLVFFVANLVSAIGILVAAPLARRIGLLNTMVFAHLPANVLLMLVPFMPSFSWAVALLVVRQIMGQLDVPAGQSFAMGIVAPGDRAAVAGLTSVARNCAMALSPVFAGAALATPTLGLPFLIAGGLKIIYDLAILATFRGVRPPEESK
jgi:predicted MFS family arabinose efflux permease